MADFRYCLNASTIRSTPVLEQIRVAAEAGFEAIELWHADLDGFLDRGGLLPDVRHAAEEAGLVIPTTIYLSGWCQPEGDDYEKARTECLRRLDHAAEVGAPFAIAGPPEEPVDLEFVAKRYGQLLELAHDSGVRPALEYLGFVQGLNTLDKAVAVLKACDHPAATVVVDPFHNSRGGGGHAALTQLRAEQVAICHFNDIPDSPAPEVQQDSDRVMPGAGVADLQGLLQGLREIGYDGFLSLELFRSELWERDPVEVAREGLAAMQAVVESAPEHR